jgi:hypothetical protein
MDLKCHSCGLVAPKVEFRHLNMADSAGAAAYRQCPACHVAVYCDESEDDYATGKVWGTSNLRGKTFTRANRPGRKTDKEAKGAADE